MVNHGTPTLALSGEIHGELTQLLDQYRRALEGQRKKIAGFDRLPHPGNFVSAIATRDELSVKNVIGPDGVVETLDKYIAYLNDFQAAVDHAFKTMRDADGAAKATRDA